MKYHFSFHFKTWGVLQKNTYSFCRFLKNFLLKATFPSAFFQEGKTSGFSLPAPACFVTSLRAKHNRQQINDSFYVLIKKGISYGDNLKKANLIPIKHL